MATYYDVEKIIKTGEKINYPYACANKRTVAVGDMLLRKNAFDITEKLGEHPDLVSPMYVRFNYYLIPEVK